MRLHIVDNVINKIKLKKLITGFSLIELMVVVAIIGILSSIAVPAYDGYMVRSRITHLINAARDAKAAISEYRIVQGIFPPTIGEVYTFPNDNYYSVVYTPACTAPANTKYVFNVPGNGKVFPEREPTVYMTGTWTPSTATSTGVLNWKCEIYFSSSAAVSPKYIPQGCVQLTTAPANGTDCS